MKKALTITLLLTFSGLTLGFSAEPLKEYQLKAAFLYKFLLFVHWPEQMTASSDPERDNDIRPNGQGREKSDWENSSDRHGTITLGIVGQDPFGKYLDEVEGKLVATGGKKKKLLIKRYGLYRNQADLKNLQLLFICSSEKKNLNKILSNVKDSPVLTVADMEGFLKAGGMVNLITVGKKIRWEINQTSIQTTDLRLDSMLLQSAVNIKRDPNVPVKNRDNVSD